MIPEIYMERDRQNFFSFWTIFCSFTPPPSPLNNPKNQNFEKQMKKTPRDIIILHKCTIHDNHKTDRFFLSSWDIFCPFIPFALFRDIIILHKCTKNHDHRLHCSRDMARDACNCYFSF